MEKGITKKVWQTNLYKGGTMRQVTLRNCMVCGKPFYVYFDESENFQAVSRIGVRKGIIRKGKTVTCSTRCAVVCRRTHKKIKRGNHE